MNVTSETRRSPIKNHIQETQVIILNPNHVQVNNVNTCATGNPRDNALNTGNPRDNALNTGNPRDNALNTGNPASQVYQHFVPSVSYATSPLAQRAASTSNGPVQEHRTSISPLPAQFSQPVAEASMLQTSPNSRVPIAQAYIETPQTGSPGQPMVFSTPYQTSSAPYFHQYSMPPYQSSAQDIAVAIAEGMEAARLPTPTLNVFTGNPLEWPTWKAAFETVIEKRATNARENILYLQQYLAGEPKKIVEGYQFVQTAAAFQEAKRSLEKRFGHPSVVAEAFRSKLENWQRVAPKDSRALREFPDFLQTCSLAMQSVEDLETLNTQHGNKQLLKILPNWMHPRWGVKVRDYQLVHGDTKYPPFKQFVKFVTDTAEVQCLPVLAGLDSVKPAKESSSYRNTARGRSSMPHRSTEGASFSTEAAERNSSYKDTVNKCLWCKSSHNLNVCREFSKKPTKEKVKFIIRKGLCLRCLQHGHMSKENKCIKLPSCDRCSSQNHPTCLHEDKPQQGPAKESAESNCTSVCKVEDQQFGRDHSLIVPVWISSTENPVVEKLTYALIDSQSNATFISEGMRAALGVEGVDSHLRLSTMHKENEMINCKKIKGLEVKDFKRQVTIPLPSTFTRPTIPCKPSQIPKPEVARHWDHLACIAEDLMPYRKDVEVGLLIGTNCVRAVKPREVIPGKDDDPYGIRTELGWGIVGRVCKQVMDESKFRKDYTDFMEKTLKNCAEKVTQESHHEGRINYVVHHGVYHPQKPDKIRVVFDCSAHYEGTSLNKNLLQGPDLTNNLLGVLCRFRKESVAIACDVEGMFHQFFVDEADRNLLRFFWWEDGNIDGEPTEYRMKVHLFGAAASPGCANFGFKRAADDGQEEFGADAANFIKRDFYVDDGLKSVQTSQEAIELIDNCKAICAKAGLRLQKISSNSPEVIQAVPVEDRAKSLQEIDFMNDPLPIERTLGIMWCIETDCFQFRIVVQDTLVTGTQISSNLCGLTHCQQISL
ncbi:hypothetical protein QZH41_016771 [Actinostola sp. cb2023]|nr:hypothetical protein QZH41_016771 [Actinostola sp. cb2023]